MPGLEIKTDLFTSIAASWIGRDVILVIMFVETLKTDVIVFKFEISINTFLYHIIKKISLFLFIYNFVQYIMMCF
jgi:hypothetical protein